MTKAQIIQAVLNVEMDLFEKLTDAEKNYGMDNAVTNHCRANWSGAYEACKAIGLYQI